MNDAAPAAARIPLEARYDGVLPPQLERARRYGTLWAANLARAEAEVAFFRRMTHAQLRAMRRRRRDGTFYPDMRKDLAFYRAAAWRWRLLVHHIRSARL